MVTSAIGRCDWCDLDWDLSGEHYKVGTFQPVTSIGWTTSALQGWNDPMWQPGIFAPLPTLHGHISLGECGSGNVHDINQRLLIFHHVFFEKQIHHSIYLLRESGFTQINPLRKCPVCLYPFPYRTHKLTGSINSQPLKHASRIEKLRSIHLRKSSP